MNYKKLIVCTLLLLPLLWAGCSGESSESEEPNNTIEEANPVSLDEPFNMKIDEKGDADWYSVDIPEQGYLQIMAKNVPDELVLEGAVAILKEWDSDNFLKSWTKLPCAVAIPEKGTYHIVIIDNYNDAMSDTEFELKFTFLKEFDEFENNNSPETAKQVEFDKEYKTGIYPQGDNDWYKIKTEKQGYLTVKAKNVPKDVVLQTRYSKYDEYSAEKIEVIRSYGKLPYSAAIVEPGEYYFQILDDYNDAGSDKVFDWKIVFTEEFDAAEPNNSFKDAKEITEADTLSLAIFPAGDIDIYKVNVTKPGIFTLSAKDYESITPEVNLAMKDTTGKDELVKIGGWNKFPAEIEIPDTVNAYYLRFIDDYNDEESSKVFSVKVEFK